MIYPSDDKIKGRTWELRTFRMWRRLRCSEGSTALWQKQREGSPTIRWATSSPWMALTSGTARLRLAEPDRPTLGTSSPTRWRGWVGDRMNIYQISSKANRAEQARNGGREQFNERTIKSWSSLSLRPVWHSASPKDPIDSFLEI